jgi:RNA polymerase sigma factor (sigma-70 family)
MDVSENQRILQGIRSGDRVIILDLYRQLGPMIHNLVIRNSGSKTDASDIFQEGLVVLFEKIQDPDFRLTSSYKTLLYAICRNLWLQQLDKRKRMPMALTDDIPEEQEASFMAENAIREQQKYDLYRKHFKKLGDDCQRILKMFIQGESLRKISESMGFTEKYAKKRKYICQKNLIEAIRKDRNYLDLINLAD